MSMMSQCREKEKIDGTKGQSEVVNQKKYRQTIQRPNERGQTMVDKTNDWTSNTNSTKTGDQFRSSRIVSSSCTNSDSDCAALLKNQVINHENGKKGRDCDYDEWNILVVHGTDSYNKGRPLKFRSDQHTRIEHFYWYQQPSIMEILNVQAVGYHYTPVRDILYIQVLYESCHCLLFRST